MSGKVHKRLRRFAKAYKRAKVTPRIYTNEEGKKVLVEKVKIKKDVKREYYKVPRNERGKLNKEMDGYVQDVKTKAFIKSQVKKK